MRYFFAIVTTILSILAIPSQAQPLACYTTIQNEVMVWNRGMLNKIDFLPTMSMKIGRTSIAYLDNARTFKVFYNGGVQKLNTGFTNNYFSTDNLVAYLNQKALFVFDRGNTKLLTGICDQYFVADSVIFFLDGVKSDYKVYYNGSITSVEGFIPDSVLSNISVSDNIVAYDNFANQFRIYYCGQKYNQEDYKVNSFKSGRSTVAYVDIDKRFKIFHKGKTFTVENFPPQSYIVGDNVVAYVSTEGNFNIFYNDSVQNMGYFNPQYQVGDNVVAYRDPTGYLKIFYKGDITDMDNYYPSNMVIQYNSLAYINVNNTLRLFSEGEVYDVTNADLADWSLNYDVITYRIGLNINKIFYKGTEY